MKAKFSFFRNFHEYRVLVRERLFSGEFLQRNPFFSRMVDFVLVNAAPIFYWPETEAERLAYLGAYRIIPVVHPSGPHLGAGDRYKSPIICGLAHAHEFAHNLFGYPTSLADLTPAAFDIKMQEKEHAASNFSEVLVYYLMPGLRELVGDAFFMPGWYDRLIEMGYTDMPKVSVIAEWRKDWLNNPDVYDSVWAPGEKYRGLRTYMRRFHDGNEDFNHKRMQALLGIEGFSFQDIPGLDPNSYLSVVQNFSLPQLDLVLEENWQRKQLTHFQLVWALFGKSGQLKNPMPPQSYAELGARVQELDTLVVSL